MTMLKYNRNYLCEILEREFNVLTAANGREALKIITSENVQVDLVLSGKCIVHPYPMYFIYKPIYLYPQNKFKFIFLGDSTDLRMPEMNGYDLLQSLRSNPETQLIPFILLAAKVDEEASVKSLYLCLN